MVTLGSSRLAKLVLAGVAVLVWLLIGERLATFVAFLAPELTILFLAWLTAFALEPTIRWFERRFALRRRPAAMLVYAGVLSLLGSIMIGFGSILVGTIIDLVSDSENLRARLPELLAQPQAAFARLGIELDLQALASGAIDWIVENASSLATPLGDLAFGGLFLLFLLLVILSMAAFISFDAPRLGDRLHALLPARLVAEWDIVESHLSRSFGGFLRGQLLLGLIYGAMIALIGFGLGLPFAPLVAISAGLAMTIPFFGPLVAPWPPILVALLVDLPHLPLLLAAVVVATLVLLNFIVPRLMSGAVGLHPVAVIAAVLIGARIAGPLGAIFGLPIAAALVAITSEILPRYLPASMRRQAVEEYEQPEAEIPEEA